MYSVKSKNGSEILVAVMTKNAERVLQACGFGLSIKFLLCHAAVSPFAVTSGRFGRLLHSAPWYSHKSTP